MTLQRPEKVKLVIGVLTRFEELVPRLKEKLVSHFSSIDLLSLPIPFNYTDYYKEDMGNDLFRILVSFRDLIYPDQIVQCKLTSNDLEERFKEMETSVKRPVNLDPGYLELSKLVLASTKNFSHRVYLTGGIYAEVTLVFSDKKYHGLPWSYPDYVSAPYLKFFHKVRTAYHEQLRSRSSVI